MITFFDLITSIWAQRFLQKSNALPRNFTEVFRIKQQLISRSLLRETFRSIVHFFEFRTFNKITSTNDKAQ